MRREKASARPLRTMAFTVLSIRCRTKNVIITETGMERKMAAVARPLPRKIRIIMPVRTKPIPPSRNTVLIACLTKSD